MTRSPAFLTNLGMATMIRQVALPKVFEDDSQAVVLASPYLRIMFPLLLHVLEGRREGWLLIFPNRPVAHRRAQTCLLEYWNVPTQTFRVEDVGYMLMVM